MVGGAVTVDGALAGFFALQDRVVAALVPVLAGLVPGGRGPDEVRAPAPEAPARAAREQRGPPARPRPATPPAAAPERAVRTAGVIDGPPPPVAPAVINRDAEGRATIRATRLTEALTLDGQLDESVYATVPAISDFIQQMPDEGAPASEKTDAWILFDEANLYVGARIWDSAPPSEWIANEMRRDSFQLFQNETFWVGLDTFYDRRNGVVSVSYTHLTLPTKA